MTCSVSLSTGTWYFVAETWNNLAQTMFVSGTSCSNTAAFPIVNFVAFTFGQRGISGTNFLGGSLDDIRIYNVALTAAQVAQLYAYGLEYHN